MAVHLGLKYGGSPSWFYHLSPKERTQVLAYERWINRKKPSGKKSNLDTLKEGISITSEEAANFWLSDG